MSESQKGEESVFLPNIRFSAAAKLTLFCRVVHAKGAGAYGEFEVTNEQINITDYTDADFLKVQGGKTPLFARFSTVVGERGSADSVRDTRGFAFKLYTKTGNLDWVFFSTVSLSRFQPSPFVAGS